MILRFILRIEKHRGRRWRISLRRAPYSGQRVLDRGWGWRRLIGCDKCSGVGYLDTSEAEYRYREDLMNALDIPEPREFDPYARGASGALGAVWIEQNHAADEPLSEPESARAAHYRRLYGLDPLTRQRLTQGQEEASEPESWEAAYGDVMRQNSRPEGVDKEF